MSLGIDRINELTAYFIKTNAENKLWELQKISLSFQPQTEQDAHRLSGRFDEIIDLLEDQIRMADGKERKEDYYDGTMRMVG